MDQDHHRKLAGPLRDAQLAGDRNGFCVRIAVEELLIGQRQRRVLADQLVSLRVARERTALELVGV